MSSSADVIDIVFLCGGFILNAKHFLKPDNGDKKILGTFLLNKNMFTPTKPLSFSVSFLWKMPKAFL